MLNKIPTQELKDVPRPERWERTNKNKKFLKKPKNKTTKKQFFKELIQSSVVELPRDDQLLMIDSKILTDLETCGKILETAELSKKLDLKLVDLLSRTLCRRFITEGNDFIEMSFEYARQGLYKMFFQICTALRQKVIANEKMPTYILNNLVFFLGFSVTFKRVRNLLSKTENIEVISRPNFWEPIFFHSKNPQLCINALFFSVTISGGKSFTEDFVEKYFIRIRKVLTLVQNQTHCEFIRSISQKILESEQRNLFIKLISELSEEEKSKIVAEDLETFLPQTIASCRRTKIRCANCEKKEKTLKEHQKCSRCNLVYYCSKICQKSHWSSHKNICK